ncbi:hypothetical protein CspeluHIS016_0103170 [Cutaneotrichosporon spelunceum]|uniref:H/ACA ribonucleoprotein complex non-core subunit NAF1 n=1 Tax=Cutaneotrichosporon spelunceum TaxID=1672016 RepID=A0AAD3TNT8_9TREE|nr:hypothetical protein CspeluHIS016_0103170 [Cutaneotrichosporon spelunceum]
MSDSDHEIEMALAPTDDLAFIQSLVDRGAVVGSLPHVEMSAAEKRAEVEAAMAAGVAARAEASAAAGSTTSATTTNPATGPATIVDSTTAPATTADSTTAPAITADSTTALAAATPATTDLPQDDDLDSESSSEFESDDEPVSRADLDAFLHAANASASESDSDSEPEYDLSGKLGAFGMELDDEDEPSAITSAHEVVLPPVPMPPIDKFGPDIKLVLAGEVVSWMKDAKVEAWRASGNPDETRIEESSTAMATDNESALDRTVETETKPESEQAKADMETDERKGSKSTTPHFLSSGTVVIRATYADGWLEADSVLCTADGKVLGAISDTFGPLTSPFYLLRLPPPPFEYPALSAGDSVFVPADTRYRTLVDMAAVRDPRFRSDASNVFDEEVADDEVEWSDDEAEAAARRRRKGRARNRADAAHSHADADGADYAGADGAEGGGGRRLVQYAEERGHGRGRGRGGRGGGGGRGQGRPIAGRTPHALPPRPDFAQQQGYMPAPGYDPSQASLGMPPMPQMGHGQMGYGMGGGGYPQFGVQQQFGQQFGQQQFGQQFGQQQFGQQQFGQFGQQQQQGNAPAINPRFAAMMGMGGYWPGGEQGGPGQPSQSSQHNQPNHHSQQ